jgi:hypothetical protein
MPRYLKRSLLSEFLARFLAKFLVAVLPTLLAATVALTLFVPRAGIIKEQWRRFAKPDVTYSQIFSAKLPRACSWDCTIYVNIAQNKPELPSTSAAFFPAWSSLIRATSAVFSHAPLEALAVGLSNLLFLFCGALAFGVSTRLGLKTPVMGFVFLPLSLLLFPYSPPSSFGYSEPLFLALYIASFLLITEEKWFSAALTLGVLGITRPQGVWVLGIFCALVLAVKSGLLRFEKRDRSLSSESCPYHIITLICAASLPFILYLFWQWHHFGDPLAFVHAQSLWNRHFTPLRALLDNAPRPKFFQIAIWICLIGSFFAIRKKRFEWVFLGLSTLALTELPLFSGGLMSYSRYLSTNFGLFIFTSDFLTKTPRKYSRWIELVLLVWFVIGFAAEMKLYVSSPGYCP